MWLSLTAISVSGAEPPGKTAFLLTILLTTHKASWRERSASSSNKWFDPRTKIETVFELFGTPVIFTTFEPSDNVTSSHNLAVPNLSGVNESICAIGLALIVFEINSTSSLSISLITKIFALARKWSAKSLTASLKMHWEI